MTSKPRFNALADRAIELRGEEWFRTWTKEAFALEIVLAVCRQAPPPDMWRLIADRLDAELQAQEGNDAAELH